MASAGSAWPPASVSATRKGRNIAISGVDSAPAKSNAIARSRGPQREWYQWFADSVDPPLPESRPSFGATAG
jgi:hypothetical protein